MLSQKGCNMKQTLVMSSHISLNWGEIRDLRVMAAQPIGRLEEGAVEGGEDEAHVAGAAPPLHVDHQPRLRLLILCQGVTAHLEQRQAVLEKVSGLIQRKANAKKYIYECNCKKRIQM